MTVRPERAQGLARARRADPAAQRRRAADRRHPDREHPPEPDQPRVASSDAEMATLTASIREHGVLQPVLVAETLTATSSIAGERRVRRPRRPVSTRIPASSAPRRP
jgi:ParB family chromosome partitioning protein